VHTHNISVRTLSTPLSDDTTEPDERMSRTEDTFSAKDRRPLVSRMGHPRLGSAWNGMEPSRKGNSNAMAARQTYPSELQRLLQFTVCVCDGPVGGATYGGIIVEAEKGIQLDVLQQNLDHHEARGLRLQRSRCCSVLGRCECQGGYDGLTTTAPLWQASPRTLYRICPVLAIMHPDPTMRRMRAVIAFRPCRW
jgi:hypothetical protein